MSFSIYNRAKQVMKYSVYDYYCLLEDIPEEYEKITRKKMLERCVKIYNKNPLKVFEILDDKELEILFSLDSNSVLPFSGNYVTLFRSFLLSYDENFSLISVTDELKDVFNYCKDKYLNDKKSIMKDKEKYYFILGLFRVFGVLSIDEINYIIDDLKLDYIGIDLLNSSYIRRFVDFDPFGYDKVYSLVELSEYKYDFFDTHPKRIRLKHTYNQFVEVGMDYYVKSSPEYKRLFKYPKVHDYFEKNDKNKIILFKGCGLASQFFVEELERFIDELDEDEKAVFFTFFDLLPIYVMQKSEENILSYEDGELMYTTLMPFLEYASLYYGLDFDYSDKKFNSFQLYDILLKCVEDKFFIVDDYVKEINLTLEQKELVLGLKKFIKGPFMILKHLKDGSVFSSEKQLYFVKGILTPITTMDFISDTPCVCETVLIPIKDQITFFFILAPMPISLSQKLKKQFMKEYKAKKDKIIKSL